MNCTGPNMDNRIWGGVLAACSLLACGGSARSNNDRSTGGGSGSGGSGGKSDTTTQPIAGETGAPVAGDSGKGGEAGTTGGEAGAAGSGAEVRLRPGSWDVTGVVSADPKPPYFCGNVDFALTVEGNTMTVGRSGVMSSAPVQIVDGAYVATAIDLPEGSCNAERLLVDQLRLRGVDRDGDGEADELEGMAILDQVTIVTGDILYDATVSITFKAVPDASQPKLFTAGSDAWAMWNPIDRVSVTASEPLAASATATLTGTSTLPLVASPASDPPASGPVTAFYLPQLLPFGGTWQLNAEGKDLAGHALALGTTVGALSTLADPGVYTPDGFEGALSGMIGSPKTVTGYGSVPAISGAHSLWLDPSSTLLVHLRRQGTEKNLHFAVRGFAGPGQSAYATKNVRAGVVGGTRVVSLNPKLPSQTSTDATGDATLPQVGGIIEFDAVLDDPGQDVLLNISNVYCPSPFGCQTPGAWMIDDLKLE